MTQTYQHDFDKVIDRRSSSSIKWSHGQLFLTPEQYAADPLPMWIADMDFQVAPAIQDALRREADMGVFGYYGAPDSYREAVCDWQLRRFGWRARPEWITPSPGVLNALATTIQAFSQPGDYVLVQPPVYSRFMHDIVTNGRHVAAAPLTLEKGSYRFDPQSFEAAIEPGTKLFLLCNPHNPTGNVWTREDLLQMAAICQRHGILIVSDEVHQDLVFGDGQRHIPLAMLDDAIADNAIVCTSPSKSFNTSGLLCANVFIANERLRVAYRTQTERNGAFLVNTMGLAACETAYRHGEQWLEDMLAYVRGNQEHFARRVRELKLPIRVTPTGALYLAWLDFRQLALAPAELDDFLLRRVRLWLDPGHKYGPQGEGFMRINLGCSRQLVDEALARLASALPN